MDIAARRGEHGGHGYGGWQRRTCSGCTRERAEEEERARESERGARGVRGISGASGEKRQAGGGRGAWARTAATRLSSYWREVGDDWQRRWAGPARWAAYWAVQVSQVSLSLSLFCFLFSIFLQLCGFIKNTKTFPKILKIVVGSVRIIPSSPHLSSELIEHLK